MRQRVCLGLLVLAGCYPGPDLPLVDEVPIRASNACAPSRTERVECVLDGDTFDVSACGDELGERVRMLGIDAPEIAHDGNPADCYGDAAGAELRRLLDGRRVTLSFDSQCTDIYGRTLAYVWIAFSELDGDVTPAQAGTTEASLLVNEWMLQQGFAYIYDEDFGHPLRLEQRLANAEGLASARGLGLWSACEAAVP